MSEIYNGRAAEAAARAKANRNRAKIASPACDCGHPNPGWHGDRQGLRTLCCDNCYERPALLKCAEALQKLWSHYRDMAKSNPGFMGKLTLQDYALYNDAMGAAPEALAAIAEINSTR